MKPIPSEDIPMGADWLYEVKYDGFRCVIHWEKEKITLTSRNNKSLTEKFPEIVSFFQGQQSFINDLLPLHLDGELVILNNSYQANFSLIQKRGRLKNQTSIKKEASNRPARFLAFDLLMQRGKSEKKTPYYKRKKMLQKLFEKMKTENISNKPADFVEAHANPHQLQEMIFHYKGEGIVAKRKSSTYLSGKKHQDWFKIKNWRVIHGFLTQLHTKNDYFTVNVYEQEAILEIGKCKHGLSKETAATLKQLFLTQGEKQGEMYTLPPAICTSVRTLDLYKEEIREPEFLEVLPDLSPKSCTTSQLHLDMAMMPKEVEATNTDKLFWAHKNLTKGDFLVYMREISPYMLPFLKSKALTLIRCPDGALEEHFFQKHLPPYAPSFIESFKEGDETFMVCNDLSSLMWFANHGAIEYHIPFQNMKQMHPVEIVFDLDPPGREKFDLAIQAAQIIKQLLNDLELITFVKTSGNKGLQIHIPIEEGSMTYEETAIFTQAIALTLEKEYPQLYTTERMKNKRKGRLYIDYLQHGKDKTLIAPYSVRKTVDATVAAPLFWDEVKHGLTPDSFTLNNVVDRVQTCGCPFANYFSAGKKQRLDKMLELVKK
ncbi:DNA ligase D [Virgibacillus alimentarius]|nr:DNA ligase D [Virgibacillus alimentarius]